MVLEALGVVMGTLSGEIHEGKSPTRRLQPHWASRRRQGVEPSMPAESQSSVGRDAGSLEFSFCSVERRR